MLYSFDSYKSTDCGRWGKAFERANKVHFGQDDKVSKQGAVDSRRKGKCFEDKTGAGELDFLYRSKVKYVKFVPVVVENMAVCYQEGFIFDRIEFLTMLEELGLVRSKISTSGQERITIQTFWNHKLNKPHGAKYYKLLDACYNRCIMTLEEYYEAGGDF